MEWLCKYGLDAHGSPNTRGKEREREMNYMLFAQKIHLKSSLVGFTASKLNLIIFLAHISIIL